MNVYSPGHYMNPDVLQNRLYYTSKSKPLFNQVVPIHKNQYHIEEELGKGSFGKVYAARRLSDGKHFAVKVISLMTMNRRDANTLGESFLNEVQMSRRLSQTSRHIVHIYDFDFHWNDGWSYFVMELAQHDLEKALRNRPRLSSAERKAIWRQLVDIAVTLHDHRIVHLDIKPENLLVFPGNVIKLADLGIAQQAHEGRIGPTGSRPYSAPEVRMVPPGHMILISRKADSWSWGAVLYRMTYNTQPDYNYTPPCDRPPANQFQARDPQLLSVLRHTLELNPLARADALWLAQHAYTRTL